jgi:hypothetical protein
MTDQAWSLLGSALATLLLTMTTSPTWAQAAEEAYFLDEAEQAAPSRSVATDGDADGRLGSPAMRRANRVASGLLRERMRAERPDDLALLSQAREAEVIVVAGEYDRVQDVLVAIETNHVVIPPNLIERLPLMSTQTVMLNCAGSISPAATAKLRRFVETGGFLVSTDWALLPIARAFPNTITRGGRDTTDDVVPISHTNHQHPFMHHVSSTGDTLRWWLEGSSYPVRVLNRRRVEVLLSSAVMRQRYGEAAIAVTFPHGDGRVLHTTSHFYLQQTHLETAREQASASTLARDLGIGASALAELRRRGLEDARLGEVAGAYAMQQLLTNVIVEKRRRNTGLLSAYRLVANQTATVRAGRTSSSPSLGEVRDGFLLRELERREGQVRVRDLFGREGWLPAVAVVTR